MPQILDGIESVGIGSLTAVTGQATMANSLPVTIASDQSTTATTPTSYSVTCAVADTEYSQALPANCKGFEFQARTAANVRYAFVTGKVAGPVAPYHTLKANDYYSSPALNQAASPSTLYLASSTAGTVVEILAWT